MRLWPPALYLLHDAYKCVGVAESYDQSNYTIVVYRILKHDVSYVIVSGVYVSEVFHVDVCVMKQALH